MVASGKYKLNLFTILIIVINIIALCTANTIKNIKKDGISLSISDNYAVLHDDVHWFLQRLENAAGIVEHMLPNVTDNARNRTFAETTRVNLLLGLKHFFVGIKEISNTFKRSFETNHVQHLQHLKFATDYVHDIIKSLKIWFASLRVLVAELFRMYNTYMPEVLLGKCFGRYVITAHPGRAFYEYPHLLLGDVVKYIWSSVNQNMEEKHVNDSSSTGDYSSIDEQQNEISHTEQDENAQTHHAQNLNNFAMSDALEKPQQHQQLTLLIEMDSWQNCLKMYTADNIARRLKRFFLST